MAGWNVAVILSAISLACVSVGSLQKWYWDYVGNGACIAIMVCFWCMVILMLIAYFMVCTTSPGRPVQIFGNIDTTGETEAPLIVNGKGVKMCHKCKSYKPERCHHCSDCEQCTLKMDHHCPWVNNCVGFKNYKFFYLFLFYASVSCIYSIGLLGYRLSQTPNCCYGAWDYVYMVALGIVGLFSLGAIGLLFYHTMLLSANQTTIEQLKNTDPDTYDLGTLGNIKQMLGRLPVVWCMPCIWGVDKAFDGVQWEAPGKRTSGINNYHTTLPSPHGQGTTTGDLVNVRIVEGPPSGQFQGDLRTAIHDNSTQPNSKNSNPDQMHHNYNDPTGGFKPPQPQPFPPQTPSPVNILPFNNHLQPLPPHQTPLTPLPGSEQRRLSLGFLPPSYPSVDSPMVRQPNSNGSGRLPPLSIQPPPQSYNIAQPVAPPRSNQQAAYAVGTPQIVEFSPMKPPVHHASIPPPGVSQAHMASASVVLSPMTPQGQGRNQLLIPGQEREPVTMTPQRQFAVVPLDPPRQITEWTPRNNVPTGPPSNSLQYRI